MSIRRGNKIIASRITNGFSLFDCKWADHILNNISWLRADTFSWQSGDVYIAAYEHLASDLGEFEILYCWGGSIFTKTPTPSIDDRIYLADGTDWGAHVDYTDNDHSYIITSNGVAQYSRDESGDLQLPKEKSPQTDTIGDITITYYQAEDGHKICAADQEANLSALYESTGVAWYYILDVENRQFKLPRTKFGFTGIRNGVGGYIEAGLPNITGAWSSKYNITLDNGSECIGAISEPYSTGAGHYGGSNPAAEWGYGFKFDASRSNSIYGNSETVQPKATEMYLYFYIGNFEQSAVEQTAGITTETLNSKLDISASNATNEGKETIVGWGMPDYSAGVVVTDGYQTTFPCFVTLIHPAVAAANSAVVINIDGARVVLSVAGGNVSKRLGTSCYVDAGHTITIDGSDGSPVLTVYPLKGVN